MSVLQNQLQFQLIRELCRWDVQDPVSGTQRKVNSQLYLGPSGGFYRDNDASLGFYKMTRLSPVGKGRWREF